MDRRARDADPSRRGHFRSGEVLDQAEHREPDQDRRDHGVLSTRSVMEILPDSIRVATPEGEITIKNDFVFAMIGLPARISSS